MSEDQLARALADVMRQFATPALRPEEWTVQMLAASQEITYNQAAAIIQRALKAGAVVEVGPRQTTNGHVARAYRYVTPS